MIDRVKKVLDKREDVDTDGEATDLWLSVYYAANCVGEEAVRRVVAEWGLRSSGPQAYPLWDELDDAVEGAAPPTPPQPAPQPVSHVEHLVGTFRRLGMDWPADELAAALAADAVDTGDQDDAA